MSETSLEVKIAKLETKLDFVIDKLEELENGIVHRLEMVESAKLSASDFLTFKKDEFAPLSQEVKTLMQYRWKLAGIIAAAMVFSPFIWEIIKQRL